MWSGTGSQCLERNCGGTGRGLELDWFWLSFSFFSTFPDNLHEPLLDALKAHLSHEGMNAIFLDLEEAEKIGEPVKGAELTVGQ